MTDTPDHDSLDELLAPPAPTDAAALRQSLLAATTRRLARRRWLRRAGLAAALAACYAAGLLTMQLLTPPAPARDANVAAAEVKGDTAPPAPAAAPDPGPEERPAERAALLRRAGDRYLNEEGDPEAALRCYSQALDAGTQDDTKFSPDDSWLLMAIKNAREKEARHANNDG